MRLDDLLSSAAVLQHGESSRKNVQAKAILDLHAAAKAAKENDVENLSCDVIVAKAAEELYADEDSYLIALSRIQGVNPVLSDDARARKAVFARYMVEKYDFSKTTSVTEPFFGDGVDYPEFLRRVRAKPVYLYIDDDTLRQVYDMLCAKDLVN